jgi:hypothetical protein
MPRAEAVSINFSAPLPSLQIDPSAPVFLPAVTYDSGGRFAFAVALSDINADDKPDILVVNNNSNTVGVLLGNGNGTFQAAVIYDSGGRFPGSVVVADVNGDGKPDLVVTNVENSAGESPGNIAVILGNGNGTFQSAVTIPFDAAGVFSYVAVADVNGDGKLDLIGAGTGVTGPCFGACVGVLLGNGNGTFQTAVPYRAGGFQATFVAVADLNGDGKRDLVVTSQCRDQNCTLHGAVSALLGNGDGTFKSPSPANYDSGGFNAYSVAVGDVNGDGKPDLLVNSICANATCKGVVAMLLGNGDGTFQPAVTRGSGGYFAHSVAITDVDSDGNPDVVVTNTCTVSIAKNCGHGAISVLLGYGNGIFQPAATFSTGGMVLFRQPLEMWMGTANRICCQPTSPDRALTDQWAFC